MGDINAMDEVGCEEVYTEGHEQLEDIPEMRPTDDE